MSASQPPPDQTGRQAGGGGADPSMEDILASIRRILSEDERSPGASPPPSQAPAEPAEKAEVPEPDVLTLDTSMLVTEPAPPARSAAPQAAKQPSPSAPQGSPRQSPDARPTAANPEADVTAAAPVVASTPPLVAPAAAAAAATSVAELLRAMIAERQQVALHRSGPTIEDLVREEVRPMLKEWLDTNLAPLVERLVRAEIERVVGRIVP